MGSSINQAPSRHSPGLQTRTGLRAKVGDDDIERRNEHATAIEQVSQGQLKIAQFTDSLATQYWQLFKALSSRLDVVEKEAFGLEPAAIDAAFQLKGASLSNRDSSQGQPKPWHSLRLGRRNL